MGQRVKKAVIPAAGLGTRFLPASKAVPKEMLPIVDVPSIQLVVEEAVTAGIEHIVLVTGRHKSAIEEHFDRAVELEQNLRAKGKEELLAKATGMTKLATISSVRQLEPKGLGHAVLSAHPVIGDEPFAVLLPDDLFDGGDSPGVGQLCDIYAAQGLSCIGVMDVPEADVSKYGIVDGDPDEDGLVRARALVEKPSPDKAPSRRAAIGRYVLGPETWEFLAKTKPGHGGEIQLTDALCALAQGPGLLAHTMKGRRYDTGNQLGFLQANLAYALKRPELAGQVLEMMKSFLEKP